MYKKASLPGVINHALGNDAVALGHHTGRYIVGFIFEGYRLAAVGFVVRCLGHGTGCLEIKAAALCVAAWPMRPNARARAGEMDAADSGCFRGRELADVAAQQTMKSSHAAHLVGAVVVPAASSMVAHRQGHPRGFDLWFHRSGGGVASAVQRQAKARHAIPIAHCPIALVAGAEWFVFARAAGFAAVAARAFWRLIGRPNPA